MAEPIDIHTWFSLTYANYLVLPRSVLQSMPEEWQHRFTAIVDEAQAAFAHLDWPAYTVRALKREREFITPYQDCEECDGEGTVPDGAEFTECATCGGGGEIEESEGQRYETDDEAGYRNDPIPHYNRGRTRLTPKG